jgi:hypothetical protein
MISKLALVAVCCVVCTIANADGVYKTVDKDDIHSYWVPKKEAHTGPLFPKSTMRKHMNVCVAVGFSVERDGSTKNVRVLRSQTSSPDDVEETKRIEAAADDAISRMHYEPAGGNGDRQPIVTYDTLSMAVAIGGTTAGTAAKHNEAVKESCRVANFVGSAEAGKIASGNSSGS